MLSRAGGTRENHFDAQCAGEYLTPERGDAMSNVTGTDKQTELGRRVLEELYKASQAPARRYEFVRDGHHISARAIGGEVQLHPKKKG